jgi:hypothetical protein
VVFEEGQDLFAKVRTARHPLEVMPSAVDVRAIDLAAREGLLDPAKERLVAHVHAQCHVRLTAVAPKVALAYEEAHEEPPFEIRRHVASPLKPGFLRFR